METKIDSNRAIVVPKMSMYELDMHRFRLGHQELMQKYARDGFDIDRIIGSHERQQEAKMASGKMFGEENFIHYDRLTQDLLAQASAVVALGGDNHFQYVSHFVQDTLVIGVNSDPLTSEGALTSFTTSTLEEFLPQLEKGAFSVEEWTRLECKLNGKELPLAICDYFLGEKERSYMSRHLLKLGEKEEDQKCSGLLVATGAGSSGWYDSACRYLHPEGNPFAKNEKSARFLVTEPYHGKLNGYSMLEGKVGEGETLQVISANDACGVVTVDSIESYEFSRGMKAEIGISHIPLRVVIPDEGNK
ncbi:MAG TPA: hypothetical protein HA282_00935 [Nanoarchaeota archaeon]|nr:hypothetical protein [Nanoarchaeota archaeon]HIH34160.1 hypothetical protein [Nanoarchaeota archaeon]HIH65767.1 hypothetical protein [Nanoarchaeota archaeon]